MTSNQSLIKRASLLAAAGKTVLPLACAASASAATLNFDFFGAGLFDNSGFFSSTLWTPAVGGGQTQGTGFKLYGTETITDSAFYRYDDNLQQTVPRSDGDGIALLWGGSINGSVTAGDVLYAPYDIEYGFTFTPSFTGDTYISNNWEVTIGLLDWSSKTTVNWAEDAAFGGLGSLASSSVNGGQYDSDGDFAHTGNLELTVSEYDIESYTPTHWYVLYEVLVDHENGYYDFANWDTLPKRNGDTLTVTVPQNSIDLAYTAIPEVSSFGLAAAGLLLVTLRRRIC